MIRPASPLQHSHPERGMPDAYYIGQKFAPFIIVHQIFAIVFDELVVQGVLQNTREDLENFTQGYGDCQRNGIPYIDLPIQLALRGMIKSLCDQEKEAQPKQLGDGADLDAKYEERP